MLLLLLGPIHHLADVTQRNAVNRIVSDCCNRSLLIVTAIRSCCSTRVITLQFYCATHVHSAVYATARCPSVRHKSMCYRNRRVDIQHSIHLVYPPCCPGRYVPSRWTERAAVSNRWWRCPLCASTDE